MKNTGPIFLHTQWRSRKTAMWALFRELPECRCYYEPLHERLESIDSRRASDAPDLSHSHLRHPTMTKGAFAEYADVIRSVGGVCGYRKRFAFDQFSLDVRHNDIELQAYLERLLALAKRYDQRAVFGFSRSSLRIGWMRHRFPGFHLSILRDPHEQWASICSMMQEGNRYFLAATLLIFGKLFAHRVLDSHSTSVDGVVANELDIYARAIVYLTEDDQYFVFYVLWWLGATHAMTYASASVELNYAVGNERHRIEDLLRSYDVDVDLSRIRVDPPSMAPEYSSDVEVDARRWIVSESIASVASLGEACGDWIVSPELNRHLNVPSSSSVEGVSTTARLMRIAAAHRKAVGLALRVQLAGRPTRGGSVSASLLEWSAADLVPARGCSVLPAPGGAWSVVRDSAVFAHARTSPFDLPAGRHRIGVRYSCDGPDSELGVCMSGAPLGEREVMPLTFALLRQGDGVQEFAPVSLGGAVANVVIGIRWVASWIRVSGLSIVTEALEVQLVGPEAAQPQSALNKLLSFGEGGNGCEYLFRGFSAPEPSGCWSIAQQADVAIPVPRCLSRIDGVCLEIRACTHPVLRPSTTASIWVDGELIGSTQVKSEDGWKRLEFPCSLLVAAGREVVWVSLVVDQVTSPYDLGLSNDQRQLGIGLRTLTLRATVGSDVVGA